MVTTADLLNEYFDQFIKQVEERWNKFTEGGYRPQAMELAKRIDEIASTRDLEYIQFLKEVHSLKFPNMVIAFLKEKNLEGVSVVAKSDEKSLLDMIKKGRPWDDPSFTAITIEMTEAAKSLPSELANSKLEPIPLLKVKVEPIKWDKINTAAHDADNWNIQRASWIIRSRMANIDTSA